MPSPVAGPDGARSIRLAAAAVVVLLAGIAIYLAPLRPSFLVLQFAFTPRAFAEVIHAWPAEHLARYRVHLAADGLMLAAYGALGYLAASRSALFGALPALVRRGARWLLPLAAGFDAAENVLHWWLTAAPRFGVPLPYALAAGCSVLKWLLLFAFGLLAVLALAKSGDERPGG